MAKKLRPGQKLRGLPGDDWNELVDAKRKVDRPAVSGQGPRPHAGLARGSCALVHNETGSALSGDYPIVKLDGIKVALADNDKIDRQAPRLKGIIPTGDEEVWAVLQGPAGSGKPRVGIYLGLTWAKVDIVAEADTTCGPKASDTDALRSGQGTAKILYKEKAEEVDPEDRLGVQKCLILIGAAEGGGSSGRQLALVTSEAGVASEDGTGLTWTSDPGTLGRAILVHPFWDAMESTWKLATQQLDEENAEEDELSEIEIPFLNPYTDVPIKVDQLIWLDSRYPFAPGMTVDEDHPPPIGTYVESNDYRRAAPGYDPDEVQIWYHDANGVQRWGGKVC